MERLKLTFGCELELADWDRSTEIPLHLGVIDVNDTTVANSDGTCVNPYVEGGRGGEICTTPTDSTELQVTNISKILDLIGEPQVNHTCWLHIHVGVPKKMYNSLDKLKNILKFVHKNNVYIRDFTSICPVKEGERMKPEDRIRRNLTRTSVMSEEEYQGALVANTEEDFWKFFERKRHLVNMLPLKYQGTIEFRCFYMTLDRYELLTALDFTKQYVETYAKNSERSVLDILFENVHYRFPGVLKFNADLEATYLATLVEKRPKLDNFTRKAWGI